MKLLKTTLVTICVSVSLVSFSQAKKIAPPPQPAPPTIQIIAPPPPPVPKIKNLPNLPPPPQAPPKVPAPPVIMNDYI